MNKLITLRWLAVIEATTFLALLVATYFKHSGDGERGVSILGPIHGVLFLAYLYVAVNVSSELKWTPRTQLLLLLGGVVPFGGYVVERRLGRTATA